MLRAREGDVEHGVPIAPKVGRVTFEDAAKDLLNDYKTNGKKTHDHAKRRIDKHLAKGVVDGKQLFAGRLMANITTRRHPRFHSGASSQPMYEVRLDGEDRRGREAH